MGYLILTRRDFGCAFKLKIMLTGKAKEAFLNHSIGKEISLFETMLPIYKHALIIEWLDSVGIYVSPNYEEYIDDSVRGLPIKIKNWFCWVNEELLTGFSSRQQATEKAIIKANEIYNSQ